MRKENIIQAVIDRINAKTYLEIGVQRGKNFFNIKAPRKIAIDPQFKLGLIRRLSNITDYIKSHFFEMTSDAFFQEKAASVLNNSRIDVAFIDGLHTYEQSLLDFKNCLAHLSDGGIILFHDCNPVSKEAGSYAFSPEEMMKNFPEGTGEWNGDVWKTIVHLRSLYPDFNVFVFDCDYGVAVAHKGVPESRLQFSAEEIAKLTYEDLEKHRKNFLNLKSPEYLTEFIQSIK